MDNDWTWWDLYTYTNLFHLLIFVIKFSSYTLSLHNCVNIMVIHRISVPEVEQPIILLINFLESPFFLFCTCTCQKQKKYFFTFNYCLDWDWEIMWNYQNNEYKIMTRVRFKFKTLFWIMIGYLMGKLKINMYQYMIFIKKITIVKFFVHNALTPTACYVTLYLFFYIQK